MCGSFGYGSRLVMQYFVSFLVLQSSHWGRESWLLYFNCLLAVTCQLVSLSLPRGAMGWSAVCVCGGYSSYSLFPMMHLIIMSVLGKIF